MNGWTETDLHQDGRSGFWEVSVPGTQAGQLYKYRIYAADGSVTEHCDPYGFAMELRPACCSIVTNPGEYRFTPRLVAAQFGKRERLVHLRAAGRPPYPLSFRRRLHPRGIPAAVRAPV